MCVIRFVRFDVFVRFESRTYLDEHGLLLALQQMLQVKSVDFFVFFPYFKKPAKLVFPRKNARRTLVLTNGCFFCKGSYYAQNSKMRPAVGAKSKSSLSGESTSLSAAKTDLKPTIFFVEHRLKKQSLFQHMSE